MAARRAGACAHHGDTLARLDGQADAGENRDAIRPIAKLDVVERERRRLHGPGPRALGRDDPPASRLWAQKRCQAPRRQKSAAEFQCAAAQRRHRLDGRQRDEHGEDQHRPVDTAGTVLAGREQEYAKQCGRAQQREHGTGDEIGGIEAPCGLGHPPRGLQR